jgi:hypothetical protein
VWKIIYLQSWGSMNPTSLLSRVVVVVRRFDYLRHWRWCRNLLDANTSSWLLLCFLVYDLFSIWMYHEKKYLGFRWRMTWQGLLQQVQLRHC